MASESSAERFAPFVIDCRISTLANPILVYGALQALDRVLVGKRQRVDACQLGLGWRLAADICMLTRWIGTDNQKVFAGI